MRVLCLLLFVCVCLASAKYLPYESETGIVHDRQARDALIDIQEENDIDQVSDEDPDGEYTDTEYAQSAALGEGAFLSLTTADSGGSPGFSGATVYSGWLTSDTEPEGSSGSTGLTGSPIGDSATSSQSVISAYSTLVQSHDTGNDISTKVDVAQGSSYSSSKATSSLQNNEDDKSTKDDVPHKSSGSAGSSKGRGAHPPNVEAYDAACPGCATNNSVGRPSNMERDDYRKRQEVIQ